jgi:phage/plasmid-like protein (TIGR03299 family)
MSDLYAKIKVSTEQRKQMSIDQIEIVNGKASYASLRVPAYHQLGTVFQDEVTTSEMLELANLHNWNVRLEDVALPENYTSVKNNFMVVRDHPEDGNGNVLSVVGERYKVLQNEELFAFGDNLLDGGRWEVAGSLKQGRVVFGALALERETILDPNGVSDVVKNYLAISTSHDGSSAVQATVTPIRLTCMNTHTAVFRKGAKQSFKLRHTQSLDGRVAQAREALGLANTYIDEFEVMAKAMIEKEITKETFNKIVALAYPMPEKDSKGAMKKWETKIDLLDEIYGGDTNGMIAGNAWGAYNALTERLDWYRTARGNSESILMGASGFDPVVNAEKNKLLGLVREVAGV